VVDWRSLSSQVSIGRAGRGRGLLGVEDDEVQVGIVEGVVRLRAGGHAAGLRGGREAEHVKYGPTCVGELDEKASWFPNTE